MFEKRFMFAGSILSANLLALGDDVGNALDAGIDIIHFDVMDYHFVPNLTFGPMFLKALKAQYPEAIFDVHLMVNPVTEEIINDYAEAGASMISFHPESCIHIERMLSFIQSKGVKAGLVLNPGTAPQLLRYLWDKLDFVLVMTVNPGFGGQKLIPATLQKIADIRRMAAEANVKPLIEVDGGVDANTVASCAKAGANIFVVGSAFFGKDDRKAALEALNQGLASFREA